jgi:hypothetical protein
LKIFQWKGSWGYFLQLRDISGNRINDLNFSIQKPNLFTETEILIFQIGYMDDNADEFSSEWDTDADYYIGESFREFPRAVTIADPETHIHWIMKDPQEFPSYELTFGLKKANVTGNGFINVDIFIGDNYIGSYNYPSDWMKKSFLLNSTLFMNATNTISIKYSAGGDYLVWDYIQLKGIKANE